MKNRPMGITQSFSKVAFKKGGKELFSTTVGSGGCFGPNPTIDTVNAAYGDLQEAIKAGTVDASANDFDSVKLGVAEYAASTKGAGVKLGKRIR